MSFVAGLEISSYIAFIILVIALAVRFSRYAALPTPLRWEIYPVPHEEKEKAERGSSYYEDLEWWRAKLVRWLAGELKDTLKEMLFMVRLFYYNRKMWWGSYLFHGGIYLILAWFVLLFIGAITELAGLPISVGMYPFNHPWSILIYVLTLLTGYVGASALLAGCIYLLALRIGVDSYRMYTRTIDYFNIFFILAVVVSGFVAAYTDPFFTTARAYMKSLITGGPLTMFVALPEVSAAISVHLIILEIFLIYFPFTKMVHGLMKYISYHKIAWDNEPRIPGVRTSLDVKVNKYLNYVMSWESPYAIKGHKWAELRSLWPEVKKS